MNIVTIQVPSQTPTRFEGANFDIRFSPGQAARLFLGDEKPFHLNVGGRMATLTFNTLSCWENSLSETDCENIHKAVVNWVYENEPEKDWS